MRTRSSFTRRPSYNNGIFGRDRVTKALGALCVLLIILFFSMDRKGMSTSLVRLEDKAPRLSASTNRVSLSNVDVHSLHMNAKILQNLKAQPAHCQQAIRIPEMERRKYQTFELHAKFVGPQVADGLRWSGLDEVPLNSKKWDVLYFGWGKGGMPPMKIGDGKLSNTCPGVARLVKKHTLCEVMMKLNIPTQPQCYMFPEERVLLERAMKSSSGYWIAKMYEGNQTAAGKGLKIIEHTSEIPINTGKFFVQKYMDNLLTLEGRKFDIRIYVLITSADPVIAYANREAYVYQTSKPYNLSREHFGDKCMHITNEAQQSSCKHIPGVEYEYVGEDHSKYDTQFRQGRIWTMKAMFEYLAREYPEDRRAKYEVLWGKIETLLATVILSEQSYMMERCEEEEQPYFGRCFSYMGIDMAIRSDFEPVLIEFNHFPGLRFPVKMRQLGMERIQRHLWTLLGVKPYDRTEYAKDLEVSINKFCFGKNEDSSSASVGEKNDQGCIASRCTDSDIELIRTFEDQIHHSGNFSMILPPKSDSFNFAYYRQFIPELTPGMKILTDWLRFKRVVGIE